MTFSDWLFALLVVRWMLLIAVIAIVFGLALTLYRFVQRMLRYRRVRRILRRSRRPIRWPIETTGEDIHAEKRRKFLEDLQRKNCVLDDLRIESR